jgi:O-antigen/teichoic acid export membrane protein
MDANNDARDPGDASGSTASAPDENAGSVPDDGRNETENERLDRNWNEMLQELRVIQTGTQILTGFLLAAAFQSRFEDLDDYQRTVYLALVVTSILTTVFGLAPVSLHRALFRQRAKAKVVHVTDRILEFTMVGVALTLAGTGLLIFDFVLGRVGGIVIGVVVLLVILGLWVIVPRVVRRNHHIDLRA